MVFFFLNIGIQDCFITSVQHLVKHISEDDCIVIIGDSDVISFFSDNEKIEAINIDKFKHVSQSFDSFYKHLSDNSLEFERLCLLRWFIIKDYMRSVGLHEAIYLDSDVLLNDISQLINRTSEEFIECGSSWHTVYFTYELLCKLVDFIEKCYTTLSVFKELEKTYQYKRFRGDNNGISDMTFIRMISLQNGGGYIDISRPHNSKCYDSNINLSDGIYEMSQRKKALFTRNGKIFFRDDLTGIYIEALSIHFQGKAKKHMKYVSKVPEHNQQMFFDYTSNSWIEYDENKVWGKIIHHTQDDKLEKIVENGLMIYGAGYRGMMDFHKLASSNISVKSFIDSKADFIKRHCGIPVILPENVSSFNSLPILISIDDEDVVNELYLKYTQCGFFVIKSISEILGE